MKNWILWGMSMWQQSEQANPSKCTMSARSVPFSGPVYRSHKEEKQLEIQTHRSSTGTRLQMPCTTHMAVSAEVLTALVCGGSMGLLLRIKRSRGTGQWGTPMRYWLFNWLCLHFYSQGRAPRGWLCNSLFIFMFYWILGGWGLGVPTAKTAHGILRVDYPGFRARYAMRITMMFVFVLISLFLVRAPVGVQGSVNITDPITQDILR